MKKEKHVLLSAERERTCPSSRRKEGTITSDNGKKKEKGETPLRK